MSFENVRYYAAAHLRKRFIDGGKAQTIAFERLSQIVEQYVAAAKERGGERSGAMGRAFGDELVRMKGRFTACNGTPPRQIYRTPDAWIRVISGFAEEMGENIDLAHIKALEVALASRDEATSAPVHWLDEVSSLVVQMGERLKNEADMVSLTDYVSRSGLFRENEQISVGEWPMSTSGFIDGDLYNPIVLGLVPHVFGINFRPVGEFEFDVPASEAEWDQHFPEFMLLEPRLKAQAAGIMTFAGVRTGACYAIDAARGEPAFALLEWHHAEISLVDHSGEVIASAPTSAEFADAREDMAHMYGPGTDNRSDAVGKPSNWMPGSLRFHFVGSPGFGRMVQSLIVRPWVFTDKIEDSFWAPDPTEADETPVTAPRHTVAAAIEGNLLYADAAGVKALRLDELLAQQIINIDREVRDFRFARDATRATQREALIAEWQRKN